MPIFGLAVVCLLGLSLLLVPRAGAATVTQRPLLFAINGADVPDGPMKGGSSVAVDNATGAVYLSEGDEGNGKGRIFRYHADGAPWPFASTGLSYLSPPGLVNSGVAVDNSGGPNQSRIYTAGGLITSAENFDAKLRAWDPSGELLWTTDVPNPVGDVAVDPTGHPYVSPKDGYSNVVREYDNSGSPPPLLESISMAGSEMIDVNSAGDVFLGVVQFPAYSIQKWVGGSLSSTLDATASDVYLDQSSPTGPIFTAYQGTDERQLLVVDATAGQFRLSFGGAQTPDLPFDAGGAEITAALVALPTIGAGNAQAVSTPEPPNAKQIGFRGGFLARTDVEQVSCQNGTTSLNGGAGCSVTTFEEGVPSDIQEYASGGTLLTTFGEGALGNATGVAYNPSLDRLYVLDSSEYINDPPSVLAFGPITTGTVGDVTIDAPSAIGVATAHFSGTVNPQGTTSEWRFQWRRHGETWATAAASPPQSLPADSSDHTVEYTTTALRGSTQYQVRLVAVNTANQLTAASDPKLFATSEAAQAPAVTIAAPTATTAGGATISGTVNPQGDTTDWQVQTSTDPTCTTGFVDQPLQSISPSSNTPVNVEYELTGLRPSEHYCAQILATNSAGSTTSEVKQFTTGPVAPIQVVAAYVAPRTDTTARLNGYVNPEGSGATYRFEYSSDGSTWTALSDMQTRHGAHRQIVVASELSGLQPATTYHYRFTVENGAGSVQSDEKTFETRTTAEMQLPQRGIELVNEPDKGNQNVAVIEGMVRADGNKIIWSLAAGSPDAHTGSDSFLSTRTANGWESQPLAPPADQQVGGGAYEYKLNEVTPDFGTFLMHAQSAGAVLSGPPTFVRITDQYQQDILKAFSSSAVGLQYLNTDITSDGTHVLAHNPETNQIEEIGSEPHEVVSIMPDGQPAECGVPGGGFYAAGDGTSPSVTQWRRTYHRMAVTDASRLYFQAVPSGGGCNEGPKHHSAIYFRDRSADQTVEIDPGTAALPPAMIRSTPDGRNLFFVTQTAHSPEDGNATGDVYRWGSEGDSYTCLTCVVDEAAVELVGGSEFSPVLVSDDFSHVYFSSERQLVPGYGTPGESNVYSLSDEGIKYVATQAHVLGDAVPSHNGNVLAFRSNHGEANSPLTADELADGCAAVVTGEIRPGCQALYRYEYSTDSLECLSCRPGGVTTRDIDEMRRSVAVSSDGSTVAFLTNEPLLPGDINNAIDIYEWHNGALQLITDGETLYPSTGFTTMPQVSGMDADGQNIFFTIVDPGLTGYEQDKLSNLYDARIGGGFPRPTETPHCSEESCQGPLAAPPTEQQIGSSGLNGAGNEVAAKKGRCAGKRGRAKRGCPHHKHKQRHAKRKGSQRSDWGVK